jgi:hypothetical protein
MCEQMIKETVNLLCPSHDKCGCVDDGDSRTNVEWAFIVFTSSLMTHQQMSSSKYLPVDVGIQQHNKTG